MLKTGIVIFACFCIASVITEAVGLGLLWSRGQLNARTFREIEVVLTGEEFLSGSEADKDEETQQISMEEIENERAMGILGLEKRESLAKQLLETAMEIRDDVTQKQEELRKDREAFAIEVQLVNDKITSESVELARGVLLQSSPKDAVNLLMDLTMDEDVILLRGMPEENIAKILKEFNNGQIQERKKRGQHIYESLYHGEPAKSVVNQQLGGPSSPATAP